MEYMHIPCVCIVYVFLVCVFVTLQLKKYRVWEDGFVNAALSQQARQL